MHAEVRSTQRRPKTRGLRGFLNRRSLLPRALPQSPLHLLYLLTAAPGTKRRLGNVRFWGGHRSASRFHEYTPLAVRAAYFFGLPSVDGAVKFDSRSANS
jgi:hypothetical protein